MRESEKIDFYQHTKKCIVQCSTKNLVFHVNKFPFFPRINKILLCFYAPSSKLLQNSLKSSMLVDAKAM